MCVCVMDHFTVHVWLVCWLADSSSSSSLYARCSAVIMSALHGHISDSPTLNLLCMWVLSLLCPVLNLNRITCSGLFSLWRLTGYSLGIAVSIWGGRGGRVLMGLAD